LLIYFPEKLKKREKRSYIINVRENKPREVSMKPKINIVYMDNRKAQIICVGAGNEPWDKEEIQGMLDYYNRQPEVYKAGVTGIKL
tara:strand:- start:199 stop:456 length:258 start_codon:yes stop_codon:yes gene_type:complete